MAAISVHEGDSEYSAFGNLRMSVTVVNSNGGMVIA
jgi:hypothetical protein